MLAISHTYAYITDIGAEEQKMLAIHCISGPACIYAHTTGAEGHGMLHRVRGLGAPIIMQI